MAAGVWSGLVLGMSLWPIVASQLPPVSARIVLPALALLQLIFSIVLKLAFYSSATST